MILASKKRKDPAEFWQEYETRIGENVLAYSLGQYIRGWEDWVSPLWGLLIVSKGGFRFHHFPHESWIEALSRTTTGGDPPQEKTIFIPKEHLIAAELRIEKSWWKQLLYAGRPLLVIRYQTSEGLEKEVMAETEKNAEAIVLHIRDMVQ